MKNCPRCGVKFNNVLESLDHERNFKHEYRPMDPQKKDAIVAHVEKMMSLYLIGHGVAEPKTVASEIVIERFPNRFNAPHDVLVEIATPNWAERG